MNIIIVGCGKTGYTIARYLSSADNDIVMIDIKPFDQLTESLDVLVLQGNGIRRSVLEEAGAQTAGLIISVLPSDEANVICCMTAKMLGTRYAAARVRDPEYAAELYSTHREFGVDLVINPDQLSAMAVSRLLRYPSADDIEIFANGYMELVSFRVMPGDSLDGINVAQAVAKYKTNVVFAMINRDGSATIPRGDSALNAGDMVSILGQPSQITEFFRQTKKLMAKAKDVMIIGGGTITYYLAKTLSGHGISSRILEISEERCNTLSQALPDSLIIKGDGTDEDLLHEEHIRQMDAVVCLTDRDEENIVVGLYGRRLEIPKVVVKINHLRLGMASNLNLGSIISPQILTAEQTANYVSGLHNAEGKNTKTAYTVLDNDGDLVEVLEFHAAAHARCLDTPLAHLRLKRGLIIGGVIRKTKILLPVGSTEIHAGDTVIVVTGEAGLSDLDDILAPEAV